MIQNRNIFTLKSVEANIKKTLRRIERELLHKRQFALLQFVRFRGLKRGLK